MFSATLPPWQHQEEYDALKAEFMPLAESAPQVQRLCTIGGTTGDFYRAIADALPEADHPRLYQKFITGNSAISPFHGIAADLRDSQHTRRTP